MLITAADLESGAVIDARYEILQLLGAGGMGWVLKVRDRRLNNHELALKLLYPHLVSTENSFARFRSEVSITRRLSHSAIVQTFGFGRAESGLPYVAMEYVAGQTLKGFAAACCEQLVFAEIERILAAVAEGLAFAHAKGVIHRDLKPENILVRTSGEIKIADFGLAQMFREESRLTKTGTVIGTAYYMSPEQFYGEPLTRRSDIYSLGIMAWELAAGFAPFQGETLYQLAEQHLSAPLPQLPNSDFPPWFSQFVNKCAAKAPEARFSSMDEVLFFLEAHGTHSRQKVSGAVAVLPEADREYRFEGIALRFGGRQFLALFVAGFFAVAIIASRVDSEAKRTMRQLFWKMEETSGADLGVLRRFFGVDVGYHEPDGFFTVSNDAALKQVKLGKSPNLADPATGKTLLHRYAESYEVENKRFRIGYLIEQGANPNLRDKAGHAPLHSALLGLRYLQAEALLQGGADPNLRFPTAGKEPEGLTPLAAAVRGGQHRIVSLLLAHKANPDQLLAGGRTALHYAAEQADSEAVRLLLEYGAAPDIEDGEKRTPLMLAEFAKGDEATRSATIRLLAEAMNRSGS